MCPRSAPQMGFHFNWHSPTSIRQHDKHGDRDRWGEPYTYAPSYGGGSYLFMWDSDHLKMFMLSFSRLWQAPNRSIWARWFLVCVLYICLCAGDCGCRVRTPAIHWSQAFLWSLAFVCQIYFSCRPSFCCHSLTHGSDRSWVLLRWENNTYLWPLELFLLQKPQRKNALAAHTFSNVYQGTLLLKQEEQRDISRQVRIFSWCQLWVQSNVVKALQHAHCMYCAESPN